MFSIGEHFLDALLPGGECIASRSDACWESNMVEEMRGERMQAKQKSSQNVYLCQLYGDFAIAL